MTQFKPTKKLMAVVRQMVKHFEGIKLAGVPVVVIDTMLKYYEPVNELEYE